LSGTRGIAAGAAICGVALAVGLLLGYPAEVGAAATVAFASLVSVIVIRDLAARAELHARPRRRAPLGEPLAQLSEVDKTLSAALSSGLGDRDLRSLLRPIAATRLARRGVDLDRHEAEARSLLGDELWELVGAEASRHANTTSKAELSSLIERLEQT
jgi:hypothetical protein